MGCVALSEIYLQTSKIWFFIFFQLWIFFFSPHFSHFILFLFFYTLIFICPSVFCFLLYKKKSNENRQKLLLDKNNNRQKSLVDKKKLVKNIGQWKALVTQAKSGRFLLPYFYR